MPARPFLLPLNVSECPYFYAIHPEVQARFFAVCNGTDFSVYDVREIDERYQSILQFELRALPENFPRLRELIGSDRVRDEAARRALTDLDTVLRSELRKERLDEIGRRLQTLVNQAREVVEENKRTSWRRSFESEAEDIRAMFPGNGPVQMARCAFEFFDTPHHFGIVFNVFKGKLDALSPERYEASVREVMGIFAADISTIHRVHLIEALLGLLPSLNQVLGVDVCSCLKNEIEDLVRGFPLDERRYLLWQLEGLFKRVPYKVSFVQGEFAAQFQEFVDRKKSTLPEDVLIFYPPTIWGGGCPESCRN